MKDLAAWMLQQIHVDRVTAELAARDWIDGEDGDEMADQPDSILVGAHLVRWSPARVLAECDARRRRVQYAVDCLTDWDAHEQGVGHLMVEELLRMEALPYADRDGYRDEWRPR